MITVKLDVDLSDILADAAKASEATTTYITMESYMEYLRKEVPTMYRLLVDLKQPAGCPALD